MSFRDHPPSSPAEETSGPPWGRVLVWLMRILSVIWLAKGLAAWAAILGVPLLPGQAFEEAPPAQQTLIIAFSIFDLVAAVGLWLTASWGGVMWIFAVMSTIIIGVAMPESGIGLAQSGSSAVLVLVYLTVSWLTARQHI